LVPIALPLDGKRAWTRPVMKEPADGLVPHDFSAVDRHESDVVLDRRVRTVLEQEPH